MPTKSVKIKKGELVLGLGLENFIQVIKLEISEEDLKNPERLSKWIGLVAKRGELEARKSFLEKQI